MTSIFHHPVHVYKWPPKCHRDWLGGYRFQWVNKHTNRESMNNGNHIYIVQVEGTDVESTNILIPSPTILSVTRMLQVICISVSTFSTWDNYLLPFPTELFLGWKEIMYESMKPGLWHTSVTLEEEQTRFSIDPSCRYEPTVGTSSRNHPNRHPNHCVQNGGAVHQPSHLPGPIQARPSLLATLSLSFQQHLSYPPTEC